MATDAELLRAVATGDRDALLVALLAGTGALARGRDSESVAAYSVAGLLALLVLQSRLPIAGSPRAVGRTLMRRHPHGRAHISACVRPSRSTRMSPLRWSGFVATSTWGSARR